LDKGSARFSRSVGRDGLQKRGPREYQWRKRKLRAGGSVSRCGVPRIEVQACQPQMVAGRWRFGRGSFGGIRRRRRRSRLCGVTPNMRGYEDAFAAKAGEIAVFRRCSEGFRPGRINAQHRRGVRACFSPPSSSKRAWNIPVRGYVSCVVKCPFDKGALIRESGPERLQEPLVFDAGCYEVSLGRLPRGRHAGHRFARMLPGSCARLSQ